MRIVDAAEMLQGLEETPAAAPLVPPEKLSPELEAVRLFAKTGSLAAVSREMNVPIFELKKLSRSDWFQRELAELRRAEAAQLNAELTRLHDSTLAQLKDRLERGDVVFTGTGLRRVPLSASTLARVADTVFNQRQLVRQQPTAIVEDGNKKLEALARQLRALGAKDPGMIDIEVPGLSREALPQQEVSLRSEA